MFDIAKLAAQDTFDIPVLNPATGEPLLGEGGVACSVTAYGPGTKPFAAARSRASNRAMKRLRARGKTDTTPEEDIAATAEFLKDITVSFNAFTYGEGEQGPDMFRACYMNTAMGWLTDQVNSGAGDWSNFTQAAPSS